MLRFVTTLSEIGMLAYWVLASALVIGLTARFGSITGPLKFKLETIAAVLMLCAGLMAISYWTITGEFSLTWWAVNIWLIIAGMANLILSKPDATIPA